MAQIAKAVGHVTKRAPATVLCAWVREGPNARRLSGIRFYINDYAGYFQWRDPSPGD